MAIKKLLQRLSAPVSELDQERLRQFCAALPGVTPIAELGMPRDATVVAVVRERHVIVPRGETLIQAGDEVLALVTPESEEPVKALLIGALA